MVRRWSKVKGVASKGERLPQFGQHAVDLQGLGDHDRALVADLAAFETETTGKRARGQGLVKGRSGDGQGSARKPALTRVWLARR
eukprot:4150367-Prymnesium_polylepis.1